MRYYTGRLALAMALTLVGYLLIYRALQLRWGATHVMARLAVKTGCRWMSSPGMARITWSISARPEEIWP
jgi:hypothetical protein